MDGMFWQASVFDQPIGNWNTSAVQQMNLMFENASNFNQPLGDWNTSSVTNMQYMFKLALNFDKDIKNWDVSSVTAMNEIFRSSSFNQDLSYWNVSAATDMTNMFLNTHALSDANKGKIHNAFSTNSNWPYDWSAFVTTAPPNQTGDNNQTAPPPDNNGTSPTLITLPVLDTLLPKLPMPLPLNAELFGPPSPQGVLYRYGRTGSSSPWP